MDILWKQSCELHFYGDGKISFKIVWDFYGENMVNQIIIQSPH